MSCDVIFGCSEHVTSLPAIDESYSPKVTDRYSVRFRVIDKEQAGIRNLRLKYSTLTSLDYTHQLARPNFTALTHD